MPRRALAPEINIMAKLSIRDLELPANAYSFAWTSTFLWTARASPTIRAFARRCRRLNSRGSAARLVLASHLGRPKGKPDPKYSLKPVAAKLAELLGGVAVEFAADCVGADAEAKSRALANGGVLLLENVRYHAEEEANDENFSRQLAALCDGCLCATPSARPIARTPPSWELRAS
jgi:phosphoglycerate kinase